MKPEPKSIFTSQKDFSSQSNRGRIAPPTTTSPSSTTAVPPSPLVIHRGTGLQTKTPEETKTNTDTRRESAGRSVDQKGRADSLTRATSQVTADQSQLPANVSLQEQDTPLNPEKSTFRRPEIPHSQHAFLTTPTLQISKHSRSEDNGAIPGSTERPPKRTRLKLRPRHTLNPESFQSTFPKRQLGSPPSPLFFSHTSRQRPILAPSFSSSEAAATMLNKARDEHGGVTTLKLAWGSINNASPPRSTSTPGSWASFDRSSMPRSPDSRNKSISGIQMLNNVGIIELLEQDERPTFIIDVANTANFHPGAPLQIVFANASLRAYESILEMIAGKADLDSPGVAVTTDFPEFKAWTLSFVKNGESLDICLPSFLYGGVTWTCSTLRKRLRLISGSGNNIMTGASGSSSNGPLSSSSVVSERKSTFARSPLGETSQPSDYFGDATLPAVPSSGSSPLPFTSTSGSVTGNPPKQAMIAAQSEVTTSELTQTRYPENSSFDWTRLPMSAALPRHIQFARSVDWASTPLGPIENWSFDLRAMCNLVMGSPHPAAMYWGPELIAIYNEAYILLAGQKHPHLMVGIFFGSYVSDH
jgi:hypothetical protein